MGHIHVIPFPEKKHKKGSSPGALGRFLMNLCFMLLGKAHDMIIKFCKISSKAYSIAGKCSPKLHYYETDFQGEEAYITKESLVFMIIQ